MGDELTKPMLVNRAHWWLHGKPEPNLLEFFPSSPGWDSTEGPQSLLSWTTSVPPLSAFPLCLERCQRQPETLPPTYANLSGEGATC